jgi:diguanylate cyclase (GGDEF)-like protein
VDSLSNLFLNLGNSLELEEILSTLDQELRRLMVYAALSVWLVEDGGCTPAYATGVELQDITRTDAGPCEAILARAVREQRPAIHSGHGGSESTLIFPIEQEFDNARRISAVLMMQRKGANAFSNDDLEILQAVAPKLASSIENARRYRRVEQLAEVDPSTGIANVRSLFQRLDAELARARRCAGTLAVMACSVEGFDRSGRLCSPAATRTAFEKVALKLRENCREYDFTARSGDELVLVLPGFRRNFEEEKRVLIQRIVEEAGANAGLPLFAAVGAAYFPEDGTDAEDLLAAAAQRVILAKQLAAPS